MAWNNLKCFFLHHLPLILTSTDFVLIEEYSLILLRIFDSLNRAFLILIKYHNMGFTSSIMMQAINVTPVTHLISNGVDESIEIKSLAATDMRKNKLVQPILAHDTVLIFNTLTRTAPVYSPRWLRFKNLPSSHRWASWPWPHRSPHSGLLGLLPGGQQRRKMM